MEEPKALAVEPETLPVVMAEPAPEMVKVEEPVAIVVEPEVVAVEEQIAPTDKKTRGKKSVVGSQIADGTSV